jgi:hypothetical protein
LASTVWTAAAVAGVAVLQSMVPPPPPGSPVTILTIGGVDMITRAVNGTMVFGMLPVVAMTVISAALMAVVSLLTPAARPADTTLARYFLKERR